MGFGSIAPMVGLDAAGGILGSLFGNHGQSPLTGIGMQQINTGVAGLNTASNQYGNLYGNVSPYVGGAMAQGQGDIQNLLKMYQNPGAYLTNLRNTTALGQFMPGGYAQNNAMGTANAYANAAGRGLGGAGAGAAPSTLSGANAYLQGQGMNQYGNAQYQLGQMQANLPLQFGQQAAQLASGNAQNLFGQAQGITGAQAGIGQNQINMGDQMYGQGIDQGMQSQSQLNSLIGGDVGGIGSMLGMQQAAKMFGQQGQGQGGMGAGGGWGGNNASTLAGLEMNPNMLQLMMMGGAF